MVFCLGKYFPPVFFVNGFYIRPHFDLDFFFSLFISLGMEKVTNKGQNTCLSITLHFSGENVHKAEMPPLCTEDNRMNLSKEDCSGLRVKCVTILKSTVNRGQLL